MPSLVENSKPSKIARTLPDVPENSPRLFDLRVREFDPTWVDPEKKNQVPVNPLQYKAHRLQQMLERVEKAAELRPQTLNATAYLSMLTEWTRICELINQGLDEDPDNENLDPQKLAGNKPGSKAAPGVGTAITPSVDPGVPADNPLAG